MSEKTNRLSNMNKPVPMKLFAAWEVDRTASNCIPRSKPKRQNWTNDETLDLLNLWSQKINALRGSRRNRHIMNEIANELQSKNTVYNAEEIHIKINNLTKKYRKIKNGGGSSAEWIYYDAVDKIIGQFKPNYYNKTLTAEDAEAEADTEEAEQEDESMKDGDSHDDGIYHVLKIKLSPPDSPESCVKPPPPAITSVSTSLVTPSLSSESSLLSLPAPFITSMPSVSLLPSSTLPSACSVFSSAILPSPIPSTSSLPRPDESIRSLVPLIGKRNKRHIYEEIKELLKKGNEIEEKKMKIAEELAKNTIKTQNLITESTLNFHKEVLKYLHRETENDK